MSASTLVSPPALMFAYLPHDYPDAKSELTSDIDDQSMLSSANWQLHSHGSMERAKNLINQAMKDAHDLQDWQHIQEQADYLLQELEALKEIKISPQNFYATEFKARICVIEYAKILGLLDKVTHLSSGAGELNSDREKLIKDIEINLLLGKASLLVGSPFFTKTLPQSALLSEDLKEKLGQFSEKLEQSSPIGDVYYSALYEDEEICDRIKTWGMIVLLQEENKGLERRKQQMYQLALKMGWSENSANPLVNQIIELERVTGEFIGVIEQLKEQLRSSSFDNQQRQTSLSKTYLWIGFLQSEIRAKYAVQTPKEEEASASAPLRKEGDPPHVISKEALKVAVSAERPRELHQEPDTPKPGQEEVERFGHAGTTDTAATMVSASRAAPDPAEMDEHVLEPLKNEIAQAAASNYQSPKDGAAPSGINQAPHELDTAPATPDPGKVVPEELAHNPSQSIKENALATGDGVLQKRGVKLEDDIASHAEEQEPTDESTRGLLITNVLPTKNPVANNTKIAKKPSRVSIATSAATEQQAKEVASQNKNQSQIPQRVVEELLIAKGLRRQRSLPTLTVVTHSQPGQKARREHLPKQSLDVVSGISNQKPVVPVQIQRKTPQELIGWITQQLEDRLYSVYIKAYSPEISENLDTLKAAVKARASSKAEALVKSYLQPKFKDHADLARVFDIGEPTNPKSEDQNKYVCDTVMEFIDSPELRATFFDPSSEEVITPVAANNAQGVFQYLPSALTELMSLPKRFSKSPAPSAIAQSADEDAKNVFSKKQAEQFAQADKLAQEIIEQGFFHGNKLSLRVKLRWAFRDHPVLFDLAHLLYQERSEKYLAKTGLVYLVESVDRILDMESNFIHFDPTQNDTQKRSTAITNDFDQLSVELLPLLKSKESEDGVERARWLAELAKQIIRRLATEIDSIHHLQNSQTQQQKWGSEEYIANIVKYSLLPTLIAHPLLAKVLDIKAEALYLQRTIKQLVSMKEFIFTGVDDAAEPVLVGTEEKDEAEKKNKARATVFATQADKFIAADELAQDVLKRIRFPGGSTVDLQMELRWVFMHHAGISALVADLLNKRDKTSASGKLERLMSGIMQMGQNHSYIFSFTPGCSDAKELAKEFFTPFIKLFDLPSVNQPKLLSALISYPQLAKILDIEALAERDHQTNLDRYWKCTADQIIGMKSFILKDTDFTQPEPFITYKSEIDSFVTQAKKLIEADELTQSVLKQISFAESSCAELRMKLRWVFMCHAGASALVTDLLNKRGRSGANRELERLMDGIIQANQDNLHPHLLSFGLVWKNAQKLAEERFTPVIEQFQLPPAQQADDFQRRVADFLEELEGLPALPSQAELIDEISDERLSNGMESNNADDFQKRVASFLDELESEFPELSTTDSVVESREISRPLVAASVLTQQRRGERISASKKEVPLAQVRSPLSSLPSRLRESTSMNYAQDKSVQRSQQRQLRHVWSESNLSGMNLGSEEEDEAQGREVKASLAKMFFDALISRKSSSVHGSQEGEGDNIISSNLMQPR